MDWRVWILSVLEGLAEPTVLFRKSVLVLKLCRRRVVCYLIIKWICCVAFRVWVCVFGWALVVLVWCLHSISVSCRCILQGILLCVQQGRELDWGLLVGKWNVGPWMSRTHFFVYLFSPSTYQTRPVKSLGALGGRKKREQHIGFWEDCFVIGKGG